MFPSAKHFLPLPCAAEPSPSPRGPEHRSDIPRPLWYPSPMDPAVALIQAYLHSNGYFTVTEYPVIQADSQAGLRAVTDVDMLAVRFPGAGRLIPAGDAGLERTLIHTDPLLDIEACPQGPATECDGEGPDFIIGEVKEGRAELNRGATDPDVLRAALTRFGAFSANETTEIIEQLRKFGQAASPSGARIRIIVFAGFIDREHHRRYPEGCLVLSLGHVTAWLEERALLNADVFTAAQFKDPAMSMLQTLHKARLYGPDSNTERHEKAYTGPRSNH